MFLMEEIFVIELTQMTFNKSQSKGQISFNIWVNYRSTCIIMLQTSRWNNLPLKFPLRRQIHFMSSNWTTNGSFRTCRCCFNCWMTARGSICRRSLSDLFFSTLSCWVRSTKIFAKFCRNEWVNNSLIDRIILHNVIPELCS